MAKESKSIPQSQKDGIKTAKLNIHIDAEAEAGLLTYIKTCLSSFPIDEKRSRYETIDKAYNQEPLNAVNSEDRQGKNNEKYDYIIPLVKPDVDAIGDYLINTFLSANQLFTIVSGPDNEDQKKQMQAVIDESSDVFKYQEELSTVIREAVRYNIGAADVSWQTVVNKTIKSSNVTQSDAVISNVTFAGNRIKRISPYNLFYDPNVEANKVAQDGDFAGYVERLSMVQLYKLIADIKLDEEHVNHETKDLWASVANPVLFYDPDVNTKKDTIKGKGRWTEFFDFAGAINTVTDTRYTSHFEVLTFYCRIVPNLFGINVPAGDSIQIWKFIVVNGQFIIYANKIESAHDLLNIVIGVPQLEGLGDQSKAISEVLIPYQELSSELWQIRRASLYRAVDDRGIYDPSLVSKVDIESKNPRKKIPLKRTASRDVKPQDAYYPIPFREDGTLRLTDEIANIRRYANELSGTNNTIRGQFQKGNKTRYEYQDVQQNAISSQVVMALMLEVQMFSHLKRIIKMNILLNQTATSLYDRKTNTNVDIDPVQLRQASLAFKIADGVANTKSLINIDALREAMMYIGQSPQFQMEYDMGKLLAHIFSLENADLTDYKRDQAGQQQYVDQLKSIQNANNPQPTGQQQPAGTT